jgi:hypothetical protein
MATTTNFGWETPDDTDLVKDGALAMRTLGNAIDTSLVDLKGGTTGQVLSKTSNTDMDFTWINNDQGDITAVTAGTGISGGGTSGIVTITNSMATEITAAGDIIVGTGSGTFDNLPIGTTGQVLTADTTVSPYKVKWATASSGATLVGCSLKKSTDPSISNATWTIVTYDQENYDTDNFHSTSTNTSRITIPSGKAGKYEIFANIIFAPNGTGDRYVSLLKNGNEQFRAYGAKPSSVSATTYTLYTVEDLAVGDYLEIRIYQDSGGSLTAYFNTFGNYFGVNYLGA